MTKNNFHSAAMVLAIAVVATSGLFNSTARAVDITTSKASTAFNYLYTGAELISNADWGIWPETATPTTSVEGDYLRYDVADGGMFTWLDSLADADGWTVELSLQVTQPGAAAYPGVITGIVSDGTAGQYNYLNIAADAVYAGQSGEFDTTLVQKDMTDGFHQVRIAQAPGSGLGDTHVWVDGELVAKNLKGLNSYAFSRHWWGQGSGGQTQGQSLIEYLRVDTSGGYGPDGWVYEPLGLLPEKASTDFDWKYEMDVLPSTQDLDANTTTDFEILGSGTMAVNNGVLAYDSTVNDVFCRSTAPGGIWEGKTSTQDGYSIEVRLKVNSNANSNVAFCIFSSPSATDSDAFLTVGAGGQGWGGAGSDGNNFALGENDNSDDFHVFRLVMHPLEDAYSVWRDGVLIGDRLARGYTYNAEYMYFGDGSSVWGGDVEIDYLRIMPGAYAPAPETGLPGDANLDGVVDAADAATLASNWMSSDNVGWGDGDFNGDGVVDDIDATMLATNWQTSAASASVPEPGCLALVLGLLLSLAGIRRLR